MPVRSKRLAGPTTLGSAASTLYTAPSGETAAIKAVFVSNSHSAGVFVVLGIGGTGLGQVFYQATIPAASTIAFTTFLCVVEGETVKGVASVASKVDVTLSGAELEGIAD